MKIKQWKKFLEKYYRKDNQKLLLETWVDTKIQKKNKQYFSQDIAYKEHILCEIDTLDIYKYSSSLGSIPYCQRSEWGNWLITVPKFGELTDKDTYKAIEYILKQIDRWRMWNIHLNKKYISFSYFHDYERDSETLRELKELGINNEN